jgi:hypothetical protein
VVLNKDFFRQTASCCARLDLNAVHRKEKILMAFVTSQGFTEYGLYGAGRKRTPERAFQRVL